MLQILRIQSQEGTKRIQISLSESCSALYEKVSIAEQLPVGFPLLYVCRFGVHGSVYITNARQVHDESSLSSFSFAIFRNRGRQDEIPSLRSKTLESIGLKHGDLLYLEPSNGAAIFEKDCGADEPTYSSKNGSSNVSSRSSSSAGLPPNGLNTSALNIVFPNNQIVEDEVDQALWKSDGKIKRQRDPKL